MPFQTFDYGNVLQRAEGIKGARHQNALMRNEVETLPTQNALLRSRLESERSAQTRASETHTSNQRDNARGVLANMFRAVWSAQDPIAAMNQLSQGEDFRVAAQIVGLPLERFAITDQSPEIIRQAAQNFSTALGGDLMAQNRPAGLLEFEGLVDAANLPPDQIPSAARIRLGMDSRAGVDSNVTVGKVPYRFSSQGGQAQMTPLASAAEVASNEAQIAEAVAGAQGRAESEVERATRERESGMAYQSYTAAANALESALSSIPTGPLEGRWPAELSGEQRGALIQTADGAVAAMAPILKQLFRTAGEGTFTDRDQALLLEMLPTRQDHPSARQAKLQAIDAIIKAKLGIGAAPSGPQAPQGITEEDIQYTMQQHGLTREQVLEQLNAP